MTENAYVAVQSRKSDVYSYGVILLELITRKKVFVPSLNDETKVTTLVNWARSVWMETGKIEKIVDSYLANSFSNSSALTKQVTTVFLLALQCTDKDLRNRPTMKDVIGLYNNDLFKWSCGEVEHGVTVAANAAPQPYIPYNLFPDDSVVGIDYHLH
jgi:serine/threonine protein kinase